MATEYLGEDLRIVRIKPRIGEGGVWVEGSLNGYRFQAFVVLGPGTSRIARLWVWRGADGSPVYAFDRGGGRLPAADEEVREVVGFLDAHLADRMFDG